MECGLLWVPVLYHVNVGHGTLTMPSKGSADRRGAEKGPGRPDPFSNPAYSQIQIVKEQNTCSSYLTRRLLSANDAIYESQKKIHICCFWMVRNWVFIKPLVNS